MQKNRKKPIIGIIGGIASGKSTVAAEFAKLGCAVIDADEISHNILQIKEIEKKLVERFGEKIRKPDGTIDRNEVAQIVFSDKQKLSFLDDVLHPLVLERSQELIEQYNRDPQVKAIVLDMPLLAEVGWEKHCDKVIFIRCDQPKRLQRASKKANFNEKQFKNREKFQISLDSKLSIADNTINNNSDFSALAKQVQNIFSELMDKMSGVY